MVITSDFLQQYSSSSSLRHVALSNINLKYEQQNLNIDQFKSDLQMLLTNGSVLQLTGFDELDDDYFAQIGRPSLC